MSPLVFVAMCLLDAALAALFWISFPALRKARSQREPDLIALFRRLRWVMGVCLATSVATTVFVGWKVWGGN